MQHHLAPGEWTYDWLWGSVLIVTSAVLHTFGLMVIVVGIRKILDIAEGLRTPRPFQRFSAVIAVTSLSLVVLHSLEACLWAAVLVWLDACPTFRTAIYFSLQMVTTLGADTIQLEDSWRLMGPLEGIGGMLMFGLSTAFLFAVMQRAWPFPERRSG